jgi:hypothetical protein
MLLPDKVLAWQSWASQTKRRRVNMNDERRTTWLLSQSEYS